MADPALSSPPEYRFRNVVLDRDRRELRIDGHATETQPKVFDLLEYLIEHRDRVIDKSELMEALWPDVVVTEASLSQALKKARRLVGDDGDRQEVIRTVQRRGFRFVAVLETSQKLVSPPARSSVTSVAVLPFADMSPNADQSHLCEGMAEEIMTALTRVEGLRVAARASSFAFKGRNMDMREIASKVGVQAIVDGSVRRAGDRLRVTAQLVDADSGFQRWSDRWDGHVDDVFAIEDQIAIQVAEALRVHLTMSQRASMSVARARELSAYELYLRGLAMRAGFGGRSQRFAIDLFERALKSDPTYVPAWLGLATSRSLAYLYAEASKENLDGASYAGAQAIKLNPDSAEAQVAFAIAAALRADFGVADRAFESAQHLNPRLFDAWYFHARSCSPRGLHERAAMLYRTAADIKADDYEARNMLVQTLVSLRRLDEVIAASAEAVAAAERAVAINPNDVRALVLGSGMYARLGKDSDAREWMQRALRLEPDEPFVHYNVACAWVLLRDHERALQHLELVGFGTMANRSWLEHDSSFDPIRYEPRFQALIARAI